MNTLRAIKYGASGSFTLAEWLGLCTQYGYLCAGCGAKQPLTADHIIPLSRRGTNDISNIQPLCKPCNSRKNDTVPGEIKKRESIQLVLPEYSENWGVYRPGSGRVRKNLHLDTSTSIWLKWLASRKSLTQEQVVAELVKAEWQKIEAVEK